MTKISSLHVDGRRITRHPVLGEPAEMASISFSFNGRPVTARDGETVAAALIAAGVETFRTMPRTGEARRGYCFVGRCTDCLMVIDGEPNVMACRTAIRQGMRVAPQTGLGAGPESGECR